DIDRLIGRGQRHHDAAFSHAGADLQEPGTIAWREVECPRGGCSTPFDADRPFRGGAAETACGYLNIGLDLEGCRWGRCAGHAFRQGMTIDEQIEERVLETPGLQRHRDVDGA